MLTGNLYFSAIRTISFTYVVLSNHRRKSMNSIITRTFEDAFLGIKKNTWDTIFFEGGSSKVAQHFVVDANYEPTLSDFPEYGEESWNDIREDCRNIKIEIDLFLEQGRPFVKQLRHHVDHDAGADKGVEFFMMRAEIFDARHYPFSRFAQTVFVINHMLAGFFRPR